jgi:hypothetical protein
MNDYFEDQLRADLAQAQVNPHPRPGLADEAYQSHLRHQKTRRRSTLAATGCAAAVAGAVIGLVVTAAPAAKPANVTTASLAARITSAISSTRLMANVNYQIADGILIQEWTYRAQTRMVYSCTSGKLLMEESIDLRKLGSLARVRSVVVEYWRSVWWKGRGMVPMPPIKECGNSGKRTAAVIMLDPGPSRMESSIKDAVKAGAFTVIGHQQIDGRDTIALQVGKVKGPSLWIDPATYLPVRWDFSRGEGSHASVVNETANYTWLPATQSNQANLKVTIPPGFHQTTPQS